MALTGSVGLAEGQETETTIVIKHDLSRGPATAVKAMLLHFSLAQIKQQGHLDRYVGFMGEDKLKMLQGQSATAWVPVQLVLDHYQACDQLDLTVTQARKVASNVGADIKRRNDSVNEKSARPEENFDLWTEVMAMHRMWGRLYRGGSVQVAKLGDNGWRFEQRGFPMNRFAYFRNG